MWLTTRITDPAPLLPDIERRRPEAHSPSVALSTQSQATVQLIKRDPVGRIVIVKPTSQFLPIFLIVLFLRRQEERNHLSARFGLESNQLRF